MIFTHFLYFIIWVSHHNLYHVNIKKVQFQCSLYSLSSSWIWCCTQKYCPLLVFLLLQLTLPISWSAIHHSLKKVFQTEETRLQSEGCPWFYCYYFVFFFFWHNTFLSVPDMSSSCVLLSCPPVIGQGQWPAIMFQKNPLRAMLILFQVQFEFKWNKRKKKAGLQ